VQAFWSREGLKLNRKEGNTAERTVLQTK